MVTPPYLSPYDEITTSIMAKPQYIDLLITPLVVGWAVNLFLFGSLNTCFLQYITLPTSSYSTDTKTVKMISWTVMGFGYLNVIASLEELWRYSVESDRTFSQLVRGGWMFNMLPLFGAAIAAIVQGFLIHRSGQLFQSKRNRYIFYVSMSVFVLAGIGGAVLLSAMGFLAHIHAKVPGYLPPITFCQAGAIKLWPGAICDALISLSLYLLLRRHKSLKFNKSTDSMINSLVKLSIKTALYTTVFSFAGAIISTILRDKLWASSIQRAVSLPLASLYSFSLFTTLSSRKAISDKLRDDGFTPHSKWVDAGALVVSLRHHHDVSEMDSHGHGPPGKLTERDLSV